MSERVVSVDLDLLFVRDQKHRMNLDIESLVESILTVGQINPITVKKVGNEYQVISGRRRYSALNYIQMEIKPREKIKALVYIKDIDKLHEELIKIDENIMRQNLGDIEFDEAIYRRKQIYEEIHPETKNKVAGGVSKNKKAGDKKSSKSFTRDAAGKLNVSKRTVEKAISRASKATDAVKAARAAGLKQSKVDLLVTLGPKEQDLVLPIIKDMDLGEAKALVEKTKKHGAKAALLYLEDEAKEDPAVKPLLREAAKLAEMIQEAIKEDRALKGKSRHEQFKLLEELQKRLDKFITIQKANLGHVRAISHRDGTRRVIHATRF